MKKIIFSVLLVFGSTSFANGKLLRFEGAIKNVTTGEFDPFVVGDACVVEMSVKNKTIALVTDFDDCSSNEEDLTKGRGLTVIVESSNRIKRKAVLEILRQQIKADSFYKIEFGAIENGLAD